MSDYDHTDFVTPIVEVAPIMVSGVWRLYYVEPCLTCGKRHYHGGGDGPAPSAGGRGDHCSTAHKPWRPDCESVRTQGGDRECRIAHIPEQVELVLASPEVIADFAERYRTEKVIVGRQDRKAAVAYLESLSAGADILQ